VRALEGRVACTLWSLPAGAGAGCCCRVPLQGAAAGCRCRVLLQDAVLSEWPVRFGGGLVVPLQAAAVGVACALWSWPASAASRCRCRVGVQGTTVKGLSAS